MEIIAPRNILDLHQHHWIFDLGRREPFFSYFAAFLWMFFPAAKGLVIQRITCVVLNLFTLWILYLLGKELAGRRAGLFLAALGAVNLDLLVKNLIGIRISSLPLAVALLLLFTFRMMRRPDGKHSFLWAFSLAFGCYTYTAFRAFLPFAVVLVGLVLMKRVLVSAHVRWGVVLILGLFGFYFFEGNSLIHGGFFEGWLFDYLFLIPILSLAVLWLFYREMDASQEYRGLAFWSIATVLGSFLMYPILSQRAISEHMASLSLFTLPFHGVGGFLDLAWDRLGNALHLLFWKGNDRLDLSPPGSSMLETGLSVLVLAAFLGGAIRKDVKILALGFFTAAGTLPYFLTSEPHSGKLAGAVIPLLALAAMGLDNLVGRIVEKSGLPALLLWMLLFGFWGGMGHSAFQKVYRNWPAESNDVEVALFHQIASESEDNLIYFGALDQHWLSWETQSVLEEGREIHPLQKSNPVYSDANRKVHSLVVYLSSEMGEDFQRIMKAYPCLVSKVSGPQGQDFLTRVEIPVNEISQEKKSLFRWMGSAEGLVHRQFFSINYGFGRGLPRGEDWVVSDREPLPEWVKKKFGAKLEWGITLTGTRKFIAPAGYLNPIHWWVDGKAYHRPRELPSGKHHIECFVTLDQNLDLPTFSASF